MRSLAKFIVVGCFATGLQFAVMAALVQVSSVDPVLASAIGFSLSALANYQLNRVFTFASQRPHRQAIPRFVLVAGTGLFVNVVAMFLLVDLLRVPYLLAQVAASGLVLVWNFLLNRHWTFAAGGSG
jgi:putative flippase GtrA